MDKSVKTVYVWDRLVRFFHWTLVTLFVCSYLTGDEVEWLHVYSGYAIVVLVLVRIVWGLIGTHYAKFSQFVYSPSTVFSYLRSIFDGQPRRYLGHNPAGGMMVIALLLMLGLTTLSGLKLYAVEEGKGPLAQSVTLSLVPSALADDDEAHESDRQGRHEDEDEDHEYKAYSGSSHEYDEEEGEDDEEGEEFWEDIHEASVNGLLLLIILHVIGVIVASRQHDENLVKSMWSGFKRGE